MPNQRERLEQIIEATHKEFKKEIPYGANLFYMTLTERIQAHYEALVPSERTKIFYGDGFEVGWNAFRKQLLENLS